MGFTMIKLVKTLLPITAKTVLTGFIKSEFPGIEGFKNLTNIELDKYVGDASSDLLKEALKQKDLKTEYVKAINSSVKESIYSTFNAAYRNDDVVKLIEQIEINDYKYADDDFKAALKSEIRAVLNEGGCTEYNTSGISDAKLNEFLNTLDSKMEEKINTNDILYRHFTTLKLSDISKLLGIIYSSVESVDNKADALVDTTSRMDNKLDGITISLEQYRKEFSTYAVNGGESLEKLNELHDDNEQVKASIEKLCALHQKFIGYYFNEQKINSKANNTQECESKIDKSKDYYLNKWTEVLFLNKGIDESKKLCNTYVHHDYRIYDKEKRRFPDDVIKSDFEKFITGKIKGDSKGTILVTGAPGIGKSSLVAYLANECKDVDNKVIIINFSDLNKYFSDETGNNKETIYSAITKHLEFKKDDDLKKYLAGGSKKSVVILDAFDEFISKTENEEDLLARWCRFVKDSLKRETLLIVTSRDNYASKMSNIDSYFDSWYKLDEFSEEKIDKYHLNITGKNIPEGSTIPEKNREVVGIPVILYMCLMLPEPIDITVETSKYQMYKMIFNLKNGIFDKFARVVDENEGYSEPFIEEHIKRPMYYLLQMLSYRIFENNEEAVDKDIYEDVLAKNVHDENGNKLNFYLKDKESNAIEESYRRIMEYPIKNLYEGSNRIEFVHKTIREYFMALLIFNNIKAIYNKEYVISNVKSEDTYKLFEKEFVQRLGSLLKKCELIRGNETAVYDFLEAMLSEYINDAETSATTKENLANMNILSAAFGKMFEKGLSYYTIDEASEDFYVENTGRSFGVVSTQEQTCFKNMVDLIQMIRELTGKTDDIFMSEWSSRKENTDKSSNEVIIPDEQYYKFYMAEYLRDCHYDRLNLSGFDLSNCNLTDVDMSGYDLRKTNMKSSNLTNCNLEFADLRGATVTDCNLTGAHLAGIRGNIKTIRANNTISWSTDFAGVNIRKGIEKELVVGNLYEFGKFPQNLNAEGKFESTPILWRVLDIVDGNVLLLSEKILDCIPYNEKFELVTWDKCTLNKRLNNEFYNTAFGEIKNAGSIIVKPQNISPKYIAPKNEKGQDESGNVEITIAGKKDNCDRIFLLSKEELLMYYDRRKDDKEKVSEDGWWLRIGGAQAAAYGTEYAENRGLSVNDAGIGLWWLRSGGSGGSRHAVNVDFDGYVNTLGYCVYIANVGVRPALWINLKS